MVAIFTGLGAGFERGSGSVLGGAGLLGSGSLGRNGEQLAVNAATGNMLVTQRDEFLVGRGPDSAIGRTYNSIEDVSDGDNSDHWRQSTTRTIHGLTGTLNTAGSTIKRTSGDGSDITYTWNGTAYVATDGNGAYDTLTNTAGVWTWTDGDTQFTEKYSAYGTGWRITELADTNGNKISFTYSGANLDRATTQNGEYEQYSWDANGNITDVVTHFGASNASTITRTHYAYTANKLTSVVVDLTPENTGDNVTYTTSYSYDTNGRIWVISETDGSSVTVLYDGSGRVSTLTQAVASGATRVTTFTYDTTNRKTTITDALSQQTVLFYDVNGNLTKIVSPAGQTQQFAYNANGDLTSVDKGNGEIVSYGYDTSGNRTSQQDALGNRVERTYLKGQVLTETRYVVPDPDGPGAGTATVPQTVRYVYDATTLNLLYSVSAEGTVTAYGYDANGNQTSAIEYEGAKYDTSSLSTSQVPTASALSTWIGTIDQSNARRTETAYDPRGNLQVTRGYSKLLSTGQFDLTSTKSEATYTYSQHGDLLTRLVSTGGQTRIESYTYDGLSRLKTTSDNDGIETSVVFADGSQTTTVTTIGGATQVSVYDLAGELISYTESGAGAATATSTFKYDALGQLKLKKDALGQYTYFFYDGAGRKTAEVDALGEVTEYRYDPQNDVTSTTRYATRLNATQLASLVDGSGNPTAVTLDSLRPAASVDDQWTFNIYDLAQRLVQTIDGTGSTTVYAYDGLSQLVSTKQYAGKVSAADIATLKASQSGPPNLISSWSANAGTLNTTTGVFTQTATGTSAYVYQYVPVTAGQTATFTVTLQGTSTATSAVIDLWGVNTGWGNAGDATISLSGPGTATAYLGASFQISGLSTTTATTITISRTFNAPDTQTVPEIWIGTALSAAAGAAIIISSSTLTTQGAGAILHVPSYLPAVDALNDRVSRMFYDKDGNLTGTLDADGYLTKIIYDAGGLKTQTIAYATATTPSLRAAGTFAQLLTSVGTSTSATSTNKYDALGQLKLRMDALGQYTYFFYDGAGRKTAEVDALGAVTEYRYDPQNDVTSTTRYVTRLNATQLASLVDGSGNPTAVTLDSLRPAANAGDQWTFNIYDLAQRLVQTIGSGGTIGGGGDAGTTGVTTVYAYNGLSQLVSTTQYAGEVSAANMAALKAAASGPTNLISSWSANAGTLNTTTGVFTQTATGTSAYVYQYVPVTAGQTATFTVTLQGTSTATSAVIDLWGLNTGWGNAGDATISISGPGTATAYLGASFQISGLSTTTATTITISRTFNAPDTQTVPEIWIGTALSAAAGAAIIISSSTLTTQGAGAILHVPSYLPAVDAANDRVSRMFYDKDGNLIGTLDAEGYLTQSIYDAAGYKIHTIAYATPTTAGLRASGIYTDLLASVTSGSLSANDIHHWMLYDARGLLAAAIDGEGNLTRYSYTSQGYLAQQISGQQLTPATLIATPPTLATLPAAAGTTVLDTTTYVYNAYGQVQSQTRVLSTTPPVSTTTSYTYDQMGNLLSTTTQSGTSDAHVFSQRYDALGRVTSALNAEGNAQLVALGANPTQAQIDTIYATWGITYTYDADSRVIVTTEALGTGSTAARTLNYYNADGTLAYVISPLGEVTEYRYNALGQRTDTIRYAKRIAATTLAGMTGGAASTISGTTTITTLPTAGADSTVHVDYRVDGRVRHVLDAFSNITYYGYDAFGDSTSQADPLDASVSSAILTLRTFDRRGLLMTQVVDAPSVSGGGLGKAITTSYGYDAFGRVLTLTDPASQVTTKTYDRAGRLATSKDALNNVTTYSYDGRGNLAAVKDALNNVTRYVYDNAERLIYTVDALGGVTQNTYDNEGRVILTQAFATPIALGSLATIASIADIAALVVAASGKDEITHSVYDRDGQLRYSVDAANYLTEFDYDATGNAIRSIAYSTAISSGSTYTVTGIQAQITAMSSAAIAASPITRNVYNADGQRSYTIDALGYVTAYTYDALGNVIKQQRVAAPYTPTGDPTDAAMATWLATNGSATNDRITRAIYDQKGQLRFSVDAESYVTQYTYNANRNVLTSIRYADRFNGTGGFTAFADSTTLAQAISYVAATPTKPAATTQFIYDSAGRLTETVDPMNVRTVMVLNQLGQATRTTVAYGTADASVTDQSYDELGRVHTVTRAFGQSEVTITTYGYDALDNLLTVQDGRGNTTTRTYDALGNVLSVTVPLDASTNAVTTNTYDAFGNLVKVVDPRNNVGYFYYNVLNQLVLQVDPEGYATATSYTFTGKTASVTRYSARATGTPTIATRPTIVTTAGQDAVSSFGYDLLDRVVSTAQITDSNTAHNITESYGYNAFSDRNSVTNKVGGTTTNTFDKRGLLLSETLPVYATGTTYIANVYTYDARGNRLTMVEASGVSGQQRTTTYTYDLADRLTKTAHDAVTVTAADLSSTSSVTPTDILSYDLRGNVIKSVTAADANGAGGTATWYYYDHLDRKIAEVSALGMLSGWTYDANGNVLTATVYGDLLTTLPTTGGGTPPSPISSTNCRTTTYAYDKNNRLISTTGAAIKMGSFDGTNFVITADAAVSQITYDAAGNVIKTIDANGGVVYSYYDKLGRKFAQVDAELYQTAWLLDSAGNVTTELRGANKVSSVSISGYPAPAPSADDRFTNFTYDAAGRRLTETRTGLYASTVSSSGVLSTATTAGGSTVTYTYNGLGEVLSKQEANGDTITYTYDGIGRMQTEVDPQHTDQAAATVSTRTTYVYDGLNNVLSVTVDDALGHSGGASEVTTNTYGAGGRLATSTNANNYVHTYGYDAAGNQVSDSYTRTSAGGTAFNEAINYRYDAAGRVIFQTVAHKAIGASTWIFDGDNSQIRYNAYGDITGRGVNGLWQQTYDYDASGHVWRSIADDGTTRINLHDKNGNATLTIASSGSVDLSTYTLDAALNLVTNTNAWAAGSHAVVGAVVTIDVFDKHNQDTATREPFRETNPNASNPAIYDTVTISHQRSYNAFGEVTSETDPRGNVTNYTYDTMGRVTKTEHPAVSYTDETGLVHTLVKPTDNNYYDVSGRLVATTDANNHTLTRLLLAGTGHGGDALTTKEFHPDTGVVETRYDVFNNARILVDAVGDVDTRTYDGMNQLTVDAHPVRPAGTYGNGSGANLQLIDYYGYDVLGQRTQHWNSQLGAGVKELTDYDSQGRVTSTVDFGGTATTVSYTWSAAIATAGLGTFGGWTKVTTNVAGKQMTEVMDLFGRTVDKVDYGNHDFNYTFDKAGQLVAQTNNAGQNLTFSYYNTGRNALVIDGSATGSNQRTYYSFDAAGNLLSEKYGAYSGTTLVTSYKNATGTWDAMGRMLHYADTGPGAVAPVSVDYEYDLAGNVRHVAATYRALLYNGAYATTDSTQSFWYKYDAMNRFTVSKGTLSGTAGVAGTTIVRGNYGVDVGWNAAGQRMTETQTVQVPNIIGGNQSGPIYGNPPYFYVDIRWYFGYTADGYLATVSTNSPSATNQTAPATAPNAPNSIYVRDAMGREIGGAAAYGWDARSNILSDGVSTYDYKLESSPGSGVYTGAYQGVVTHTSATQNGVTTNRKTSYVWWDSAQQDVVTVSNGSTNYSSTYHYDSAGRITTVNIADGQPRNVTFVTDMSGHVLQRSEVNTGSGVNQYDMSYTFGGKTIGAVSSAALIKTPMGQLFADFDQSFVSENKAPLPSGAAYTVRSGDTLRTIADELWGDANLWYKLAEANGLTASSALTQGQTLVVPQGVLALHKTSSTFTPYDPNKALGDLDPSRQELVTFSPPPPAKKGGCGVFGQILSIIVSVAATYFLGPLVGNLVSQGFNNLIGTQHGFSFKSLAISVISAGVAKGLSGVNVFGGSATSFLNGFARGALSSGITQGIAVATHLQDHFDWVGVAAAGVSSGVGGLVSAKLDSKNGFLGIHAQMGDGMTAGLGSGTGRLVNDLITNTVSGVASAATVSLLSGTDFGDNLLMVLPQVVGSALGGALQGRYGQQFPTDKDYNPNKAPSALAGIRDAVKDIRRVTDWPVGAVGDATKEIITEPLQDIQRSISNALHPIGKPFDLLSLLPNGIGGGSGNLSSDSFAYAPRGPSGPSREHYDDGSDSPKFVYGDGPDGVGARPQLLDASLRSPRQVTTNTLEEIRAARQEFEDSYRRLPAVGADGRAQEAEVRAQWERAERSALWNEALKNYPLPAPPLPAAPAASAPQAASEAESGGLFGWVSSLFSGWEWSSVTMNQGFANLPSWDAGIRVRMAGGDSEEQSAAQRQGMSNFSTQLVSNMALGNWEANVGFTSTAIAPLAILMTERSSSPYVVGGGRSGFVSSPLWPMVAEGAIARFGAPLAAKAAPFTISGTGRATLDMRAPLAPSSVKVTFGNAAEDVAVWDRLSTVGRTPGKSSATGRAVIERMGTEGKIMDDPVLGKMFQASDGEWYPFKLGDMAHNTDAVSWWNSTGRSFGAKAPEVRQWMLKPDNYTIDLFSINRSAGAKLGNSGVRYLPPTK